MSKKRLTILIIFSAAIVLMVVLAAGLGKMQLQTGEAFRLENNSAEGGFGGLKIDPNLLALIFRAILYSAVLLIPLEIYFLIKSKEARKRLIRDILALVIIFLAFKLFMKNASNSITQLMPALNLEQVGAESVPVASFAASGIPDWMIVVGRIAIAVLAAVFVILLAWIISKRRKTAPDTMDQLAETARNALDSLKSGAGLEDVVIRCYVEMSHILGAERSIHRAPAYTPREFETELIEHGLPAEPVRSLTRLFEDVRYGHEKAGEAEQQRAIGSLDAIIEACKMSKSA